LKGYAFPVISSINNSFNADFGVEFTAKDKGQKCYNFGKMEWKFGDQAPGLSVFHKDNEGNIYH
jgi:predicted dithiol-disulfide oxidoreductase (DUF899 family)